MKSVVPFLRAGQDREEELGVEMDVDIGVEW